MKPVKRIAFVLQSTAVGGMETHVLDLAREFASRGNAVSVSLPPGATFDPLALKFATAGSTVFRHATDAREGRAAQARGLASFVRDLRAFAPDAVHVHTGGATGGLAPVALARTTTRATVVITEHDVPGEVPGRAQKTARNALDRSAHAVVAVSRRNARLRNERIPVANRNFAVVLNGVPIPSRVSEREHTRAELGFGQRPVIGSLVRLAEGKGVDTLLDAFARVRGALPCRLLLVGDGPLRPDLEARASALGIAPDVTFAGHQAAPARYVEAMDVFCLAVPAGSMSIALLEAMALGLPPVITFGGPEEAVIHRETGLTARPGDPSALAEALAELVANPSLRSDLGGAARAHIAANYSVARVADDLLDVYQGARARRIPARLRATAPDDQRPGVSARRERLLA